MACGMRLAEWHYYAKCNFLGMTLIKVRLFLREAASLSTAGFDFPGLSLAVRG